MYSGSRSRRAARNASMVGVEPGAATMYAASRLSPVVSGRAVTTACHTPGHWPKAASISAGSIRKPRIFT